MYTDFLEGVGKRLFDRYKPIIDELIMYRDVTPELPDHEYPVGWSILDEDGEILERRDVLEGFIGYLDLETTGLRGDSDVLCACGVGTFGDRSRIVVYRGCGSRILPIANCVIANWNQPFDRQFYAIDGLWDTCTHLDLYGMCLAVRGRPEDWSTRSAKGDWVDYTLPDLSLATASEYYLGDRISKDVRTQLISGADVPLNVLVQYCYTDALTTQQVGRLVLQEYLAIAPNPITLHSHILRHKFVIPLSDKWYGYYDRAEQWYNDKLSLLYQIALAALPGSAIGEDPHSICIRANYPDKYKKPTKAMLSNPLYEQWLAVVGEDAILYKYLWQPIKFGSPLFALLLGLSWYDDPEQDVGEPILFDRATKIWYAGDRTLPNKTEPDKSLASPICKAYQGEIKSSVIRSATSAGVQPILRETQLWKAFRGRIADVAPRVDDTGKLYWIPTYTPTGTITHRSTDKLLLLIGSPKEKSGGSEFMSMIEARAGYKIVQADLDAGELVLSGLIATSAQGAKSEMDNDFARANLTGDKAKGTDIPSLLATRMGTDRGNVKNLVYGGTYGQQHNGRVEKLLSIGIPRDRAEQLSRSFEAEFVDGLAATYFQGNGNLMALNAPTALLGKRLPMAYLHAGRREGVTSRLNHNVQALGEDWLAAIIAIVDSLIPNSPECQLILTRHDELVYHVRDDLAGRLVTAMQFAHRVSRLALCEVFRVSEPPPEQWLHFSSVDVNTRYKKTVDSNPSTVTTKFEE